MGTESAVSLVHPGSVNNFWKVLILWRGEILKVVKTNFKFGHFLILYDRDLSVEHSLWVNVIKLFYPWFTNFRTELVCLLD
jgi:hypothetical protein